MAGSGQILATLVYEVFSERDAQLGMLWEDDRARLIRETEVLRGELADKEALCARLQAQSLEDQMNVKKVSAWARAIKDKHKVKADKTASRSSTSTCGSGTTGTKTGGTSGTRGRAVGHNNKGKDEEGHKDGDGGPGTGSVTEGGGGSEDEGGSEGPAELTAVQQYLADERARKLLLLSQKENGPGPGPGGGGGGDDVGERKENEAPVTVPSSSAKGGRGVRGSGAAGGSAVIACAPCDDRSVHNNAGCVPLRTSSKISSKDTGAGAGRGGIGTVAAKAAADARGVGRDRVQRAVRGRAREELPGYICEDCSAYYSRFFTPTKADEMVQRCSRHRQVTTPPVTPEGFWDLTMRTPEDWKEQDDDLRARKRARVNGEGGAEKERNVDQGLHVCTRIV